MATFASIRADISKRLLDVNNTAVSLADVGNAINDAISYWKYRRFWFNEVYDSAVLTINDGTIPLPTNFLVPVTDTDGFNIEYNQTRYPLQKISSQQYDAGFASNAFGRPLYYARMGGSYEVLPLPDLAYPINRRYLKEYVALSGDMDVNDFTVYAPRLIMLHTLANLIAEFRQDEKMETYYRTAAMNEYNNLCLMGDKSNKTGSLTIHSNL